MAIRKETVDDIKERESVYSNNPELAQIDRRKSKIERNVVGYVDASSAGNVVRCVGKEVGGVAVAAIPAEVEVAVDAVIADGVAGLHGI